MYKKLYGHLFKGLEHPRWWMVLEARLVRWLFSLSGNRAPDWVDILANTHPFFEVDGVVRHVKRYEHPRSEIGSGNTLVNLFLMLFVIGAFSLLALAGPVGLLIADAVSGLDVPEAPGVDYSGLSSDIENSMMEITPASNNYSQSHGLEHHGAAAKAVRDCLAKYGPKQTWDDVDGHRIQVCVLDNGMIGFQVEGKREGEYRSLTEYIKTRFRTLSDVARYMRNGGAVLR